MYIKSNNVRNEFLDIIKGITIFLVIWGHTIQYCSIGKFDFFENIVFKIIYSFHMPLFMLVSGYISFYSSKRKLYYRIKQRVVSLLIPILTWNTLRFIIIKTNDYITEGEYYINFNEYINNLMGLWFLWALLIISISVIFIEKYFEGENILFNLLCYLALWMILSICIKRWRVEFMYPYFMSGYLFNKYKDKIGENLRKIRFLCIPVSIIMILFFEKKHYVYVTGTNIFNFNYEFLYKLNIDIFRLVTGFVVSIAFITIIEFIYNKKISLGKNLFTSLGIVSLQIYVLQSLILELIFPKIFKILIYRLNLFNLLEDGYIYNFILTPIISIFITILIYSIISKINNKRLKKILFGR